MEEAEAHRCVVIHGLTGLRARPQLFNARPHPSPGLSTLAEEAVGVSQSMPCLSPPTTRPTLYRRTVFLTNRDDVRILCRRAPSR